MNNDLQNKKYISDDSSPTCKYTADCSIELNNGVDNDATPIAETSVQ